MQRRAEGAIRTREQLRATLRKVRTVDHDLTGAWGDPDIVE
ncbi:hypothetical protein AB0F91_42545 [Amycolatopsis sp. NPDC023774]